MGLRELNFKAHSFGQSINGRMLELTLPLENVGIIHFGFARVFKDNTMVRLSNNKYWCQRYFENEFYNNTDLYTINKINLDRPYYRLLTGLPANSHYKALYDFGIWNGFFIYDGSENFMDIWYFSGDKSSTELANFYFNNLDFLKTYMEYFRKNAQDLIESASNNGKIHTKFDVKKYPDLKMDVQTINLSKESFLCKTLQLSKREKESLFYLKKGRSIKEVASLLNLSPRTIETYINNIKSKSGYNTKSQIISLNENLIH